DGTLICPPQRIAEDLQRLVPFERDEGGVECVIHDPRLRLVAELHWRCPCNDRRDANRRHDLPSGEMRYDLTRSPAILPTRRSAALSARSHVDEALISCDEVPKQALFPHAALLPEGHSAQFTHQLSSERHPPSLQGW